MTKILIILLVLIVAVLFVVFLGVRNEWVTKQRIDKIIEQYVKLISGKSHTLASRALDNYESHTKMVLKFWVWDIEKMRIK